jgi:hypothetical protein
MQPHGYHLRSASRRERQRVEMSEHASGQPSPPNPVGLGSPPDPVGPGTSSGAAPATPADFASAIIQALQLAQRQQPPSAAPSAFSVPTQLPAQAVPPPSREQFKLGKFTGDDSEVAFRVTPFLDLCDSYFHVHRVTTDLHKLHSLFACFPLDTTAGIWHSQAFHARTFTTYAGFKTAFRARYAQAS